TRFSRDWISDVCSSDLAAAAEDRGHVTVRFGLGDALVEEAVDAFEPVLVVGDQLLGRLEIQALDAALQPSRAHAVDDPEVDRLEIGSESSWVSDHLHVR